MGQRREEEERFSQRREQATTVGLHLRVNVTISLTAEYSSLKLMSNQPNKTQKYSMYS